MCTISFRYSLPVVSGMLSSKRPHNDNDPVLQDSQKRVAISCPSDRLQVATPAITCSSEDDDEDDNVPITRWRPPCTTPLQPGACAAAAGGAAGAPVEDPLPGPLPNEWNAECFRRVPFTAAQVHLKQHRIHVLVSAFVEQDLSLVSFLQDKVKFHSLLVYLWQCYDKEYFHGAMQPYLVSKGVQFTLHASTTLTSTAGTLACQSRPPNQWVAASSSAAAAAGSASSVAVTESVLTAAKLSVSLPVLRKVLGQSQESSRGTSQGSVKVCGIECHNRLECVCRIVEHELVHLLVRVFCHESSDAQAPHSLAFREIVKCLFGHTEIRHAMFADDPVAKEKRAITLRECRIGSTVTFKGKGGTVCSGTVVRMNQNTVRVHSPDGRGQWRVPFSMVDTLSA
jgi:hypothetical protein